MNIFSGVNIFQGCIFFSGEYFSGVNIFQGRLVFRGEYFELVDMNLVDTDVRHSGHGHGGHRGECFTGMTIFQRLMFIIQFFSSEFCIVERCLFFSFFQCL